jgi:hypothetical protein
VPVIINDKYILPAPLVNFNKVYQRGDGGETLGAVYTATLQGTLLQNKGNPVAETGDPFSSSFSTDGWISTYSPDDDPLHGVATEDLLISTITKQERIRDLVAPGSGVKVEIVGFNRDQGLKFYGLVNSIDFDSEGQWAKPTSYTIPITFYEFTESAIDSLFTETEDNFDYYISSASDEWQIEESDSLVVNTGDLTGSKIYSVKHSLTAQGQPRFGSGTFSPAWQEASGYVRSNMGLSNIPVGILPIFGPEYSSGNHSVSETIDRINGSYSVSETFIYFPTGVGYAIENFRLSTDYGEGSQVRVSLDGSIDGIQTIDPLASTGNDKFANALAYYEAIENSIYPRALAHCGLDWLHPAPLSRTVARIPTEGKITYSYSYNNRMPNIVPGSISERIQISDTYPGQLIGITPVIGREQPILSYMNSRSEYRRNLSITVNMATLSPNWNLADVNESGYWTASTVSAINNWLVGSKPSILHTVFFSGIYEAANPANEAGVIPSKTFYEAPKENWDPITGAYSFSVSWVYEKG